MLLLPFVQMLASGFKVEPLNYGSLGVKLFFFYHPAHLRAQKLKFHSSWKLV